MGRLLLEFGRNDRFLGCGGALALGNVGWRSLFWVWEFDRGFVIYDLKGRSLIW
jgi:hypothetical protein